MFSRTHLFPLVVALAITLATGTASSAADCIDWRSVTTVSPLVSWNGPEFHDFNGGSVNDGFLVKNGFDAAYNNYYYIYDVRDPLQPTLVYETHFDPSSGGSGWLSAVEDSLFCFRWGFMGGAGVHLCLATDPLVAHRAPLGGDVAIVGNHMFQTAWFYDSSVGIGFYDISDLGDIVQLGFYSSALYWNLAPFALSDDVALFMNAAQRLQVVDFQTPSSPVLRSGIDVCNCTNRRWLGRDGDRVYYSDANNTYAIDVSDLDNLQIEFVLPVTTWHMAIKGDLAVLDRQVYRLRGPWVSCRGVDRLRHSGHQRSRVGRRRSLSRRRRSLRHAGSRTADSAQRDHGLVVQRQRRPGRLSRDRRRDLSAAVRFLRERCRGSRDVSCRRDRHAESLQSAHGVCAVFRASGSGRVQHLRHAGTGRSASVPRDSCCRHDIRRVGWPG
jgi:hypothetical protein